MKYTTIIVFLFHIFFSAHAQAQQAIVIDGDTFELNGKIIRLHGIDAPEAGQKCSSTKNKTWRCGDRATAELITLTSNQNVQCDELEIGPYGRIIATCKANQINLNKAMVQRGFAWAFRKFSDEYLEDEADARSKRIGIWQAPTQTAEAFREEKWSEAKSHAPNGCPIKGNISRSGQIYHAPWSPWYKRTKINVGKGERWFCSEAEALAAGWRAPYWGR